MRGKCWETGPEKKKKEKPEKEGEIDRKPATGEVGPTRPVGVADLAGVGFVGVPEPDDASISNADLFVR